MRDRLDAEFHTAMVEIYERAKRETGYVATRFLQLVADKGGVDAARQLIASPRPSDGFATLWEKGRLDLSVEFHVLLPRFGPLITESERRTARERLESYGFDVGRGLADVAGRQTEGDPESG